MPKGGLGVSRVFCGLHWMKSEPNSNATVTQRNRARNKEHRCFSGWPLCPEAGVRPTQIHRASWEGVSIPTWTSSIWRFTNQV